MSALLRWGQQNPKKAALFSMIAAIGGFRKIKQLLATPKSLKDKIVLITGGAGGLGKLIADKLYNKGSKVIVWDVNKESIKQCENEGKLIAKFVDVTNKSNVDNEANKIFKKYGKIDILINNAGVVSGRPLFELTEKDIRRTFDVNIISHFWMLKAFLPSMIKNKCGHIVNIISTSAFCPVSHMTDYSTTKVAAKGFDTAINRELIDLEMNEGIVFTAIYPHFMNTGMFEGAQYPNEWHRTLLTGTTMLEPEFVADETIKAIEYEKREIILPTRLGYYLYVSQLLPFIIQDDAAVKSNSMKQFIGGKNRLSKL